MNHQPPFETFLKEEIARVKGQYYPVHAGILTRLLVRHASPRKLHPNPEDEFCDPEIGPNYGIISQYTEKYRKADKTVYDGTTLGEILYEPLIVQKTMPDGYMILNGHHRWAAALRSTKEKVPVKVVNVTSSEDIKKMLEQGKSDIRVTMDLDEVIFCDANDPGKEPPLHFPMNRFFKENIRKGVPALFHFLNEMEADIWVYTTNYYSMDYIRSFFKARGVHLSGIVTGSGRKELGGSDGGKSLKQLAEQKYKSTILIDRQLVLLIHTGTHECVERPLTATGDDWSLEVMNTIREMMNK